MDTGKHWKAGGQRTIMNIQFTKTKMQKFNQDSGDLEVGLELGTVCWQCIYCLVDSTLFEGVFSLWYDDISSVIMI